MQLIVARYVPLTRFVRRSTPSIIARLRRSGAVRHPSGRFSNSRLSAQKCRPCKLIGKRCWSRRELWAESVYQLPGDHPTISARAPFCGVLPVTLSISRRPCIPLVKLGEYSLHS